MNAENARIVASDTYAIIYYRTGVIGMPYLYDMVKNEPLSDCDINT
jgi:hypothetical protein